MSDLGVNASLLVAASDLNLVRSLLGAIRTADQTSAAERSGHAECHRNQTDVHTVTRTVTLRNSDRPAATFEHSARHDWHLRLRELQPYSCTLPVTAVATKPSIEAPWKVLPWPKAMKCFVACSHRKFKAQANGTDVDSVGRTLDLFV